MESTFSLECFSTIAADLNYVLLLGQPLPELLCTAWHISSKPAPSVPLILGQCILLVSPASGNQWESAQALYNITIVSMYIHIHHSDTHIDHVSYFMGVLRAFVITVGDKQNCCGMFTYLHKHTSHYSRVPSTIVPSVACQHTEGEYIPTNHFILTDTL